MQIREENHGDTLVTIVEGHLDSATAGEFETHLLGRIEEGRRAFVVDCADLDYINSAGLKAFLIAGKKLEPIGGRIVLCALATNVQMVFELTGFDNLFTIKASRAEALASFS